MHTECYEMPVLLYTEGLRYLSLPSKDHLLYNKLFIFATEYIHRTLHDSNEKLQNSFSFSRFINLSPMEINKVFIIGILFRYIILYIEYIADYITFFYNISFFICLDYVLQL